MIKGIKIAIIAHNCRTGGGLTGTLSLLKALKNVAQNEQFMLICSAGYGYEQIQLPSGSERFVYEGGHSPLERYWFESFTLPKIVTRYNPDVIFGAGNIGLTNPGVPQALLIQQAYLLYDRRYYRDIHLKLWSRLALLKLQVKRSLRPTNLVFCQTPVVKRRFSERFCYPENRINILHWPPPADIRPAPGLGAPEAIDKSSGSFYVLLLTRYMPHRNPSILIRLCQHHGSQMRAMQIKFITTVEAEDDPRATDFLKRVSKYHLEDVIINVGSLSRQEVLRYYCHSDVLWLPTTLETLCLPFLEAMAMGVPILAPDIDFARYVCGKAALFYNPWEIESVFGKIMLMRDNTSLKHELVEKGKKELADRTKFAESWADVAADLIQGLRGLVLQN